MVSQWKISIAADIVCFSNAKDMHNLHDRAAAAEHTGKDENYEGIRPIFVYCHDFTKTLNDKLYS